MKLTENRLRAIIKEELKGVLSEGEAVDFGSYLNKQREKKAIKNIGSQTQINDLAQALVRADMSGDTEAMNMIKNDAERFEIYDAVMELYSKTITKQPKKELRREYDPSLDLR